eukprot:SAG11_NODE_4475_length_1881_cov_7.488777_2_plen_186_part_01
MPCSSMQSAVLAVLATSARPWRVRGLSAAGLLAHPPPEQPESDVVISASFELANVAKSDENAVVVGGGSITASAGLFDADSGVMVRQLFSGRRMSAGRHPIRVTLPAGEVPPDRQLELRVVSAPTPTSSSSSSRYLWEGVIGNTGPLVGPGALKGLNPPSKIQVVGDQAVWCLGYNERQPGCFVFN